LNTDTCEFGSSQKGESSVQSADSSKAYRKPRAFICVMKCCHYSQPGSLYAFELSWEMTAMALEYCTHLLETFEDLIVKFSFTVILAVTGHRHHQSYCCPVAACVVAISLLQTFGSNPCASH